MMEKRDAMEQTKTGVEGPLKARQGEVPKRPLSMSDTVGGESELTETEKEQVWKTMLLNRFVYWRYNNSCSYDVD